MIGLSHPRKLPSSGQAGYSLVIYKITISGFQCKIKNSFVIFYIYDIIDLLRISIVEE